MLVVLGRVLVRPLRALLVSLEQPAFELPRLTLSRALQNRLGHLPLLHGRRKSCRNRFGHPRRERTRTRDPEASRIVSVRTGSVACRVCTKPTLTNQSLPDFINPCASSRNERRAARRPTSEIGAARSLTRCSP